ncbi:MAG: hypothetical protein E7627_08425 [Ruminococcaceae bacterium]|nr:hypothetical protein [Oscillospiraceae bacterium]
MTKEELLIKKCIEVLREKLDKDIPEEGKFPKATVLFSYPGTGNEALLWIEDGFVSRYFCVGMREKGSDKVAYHYYAKGSNSDIDACLSDEGIVIEIHNDLEHLKETVDNFE